MNIDALNAATQGRARTSGVSPFSEIELSRVYPNENQPRKLFENIEELAESIRHDGLIQPIAVVKRDNGRYMIVSGERRFRASKYLGLTTIKAHVLDIDDAKVQELALVENIQREDLNDFEKAKYIAQLWASGNYKKKQDLAEAISKSSSYISKAFSCLKLDESILADLEENKHDIGLSVLEEISRIKDKKLQLKTYKSYKAGEIKRDEIAQKKKVSLGKKEKRSFTLSAEEIKSGVKLFELLGSNKIELQERTSYKITVQEL